MVYGESDSRGLVEVARPSEVYRVGLHASFDYTEGRGRPCVGVHLFGQERSASDGCRVRKKGAHFKQLRDSPPSTTAQEQLMVVALGHTDDDYEAWTHRDPAHAYRKRRGHTPR